MKVVRLLIGLVAAAVMTVALVVVGLMLGGADCHSGQCNWFGEFITDTAPLYLVLSVLAGLATGWGITRRPRDAGRQ